MLTKYKKELKAARAAAYEAGRVILKYYKNKYKIILKSADDPVTEADLISEKIILNKLKSFNYGILSEEASRTNARRGKKKVWIIDPLDGTKDFIDKISEFAVMIGLAERGRAVLGVIYNPAKDVMYYAAERGGAFARKGKDKPRKLKVSKIFNPKKAIMFISRYHLEGNEKKIAERLGVKKIIAHGSLLKACLIAEGVGEISFTTSPNTKEWDTCAADIILKEAGGKFADTRGRDLKYNKKDVHNKYGYLATNGVIHNKVLKALRELIK